MDDENIKWRDDHFPDYTLTNLAYFKGKSRTHTPDSLETFLENFVKTWEMEQVHKLDYTQHGTII